jgi:hypothetical protein
VAAPTYAVEWQDGTWTVAASDTLLDEYQGGRVPVHVETMLCTCPRCRAVRGVPQDESGGQE